jgi:hypothetical protein
MLIKEICMKCRNECNILPLYRPFDPNPYAYGKMMWFDRDDEIWKNGKVRCVFGEKKPSYASATDVKIDGFPPERCPFILEHMYESEDMQEV